jgi:hypothetical protein
LIGPGPKWFAIAAGKQLRTPSDWVADRVFFQAIELLLLLFVLLLESRGDQIMIRRLATSTALGFMAMLAGCASAPVDQIELMPAPDVYGDGLLNPLPETNPFKSNGCVSPTSSLARRNSPGNSHVRYPCSKPEPRIFP